jgi:hypothetical protein
VEDNGVGRASAGSSKSKENVFHESKGLAIVEERLKHLHSLDKHQDHPNNRFV